MKEKIAPEHVDALAEILQDHEISVPIDKIGPIAYDFKYHLEMCREMENTPHMSRGGESDYSKAERLQKRVNELESELKRANGDIKAYQDGVKARRPYATHVYVENGDVKYDIA